MKTLNFLGNHLWLILCGTACEYVYIFYLVRSFPLIHHERELLDMGMINGFSHAGFITFFGYFSLLFLLVWLAWCEARKHAGRETFWLILTFGAIFVITNIFVYPINAIDIFEYIAESVEMVRYHSNPMTIPAIFYASDPEIQVSGGSVGISSPYGPLEIVLVSIPTLLTGTSILANLLLLKLFCGGLLLASSYLVYKIVSEFKPGLGTASALALAWNPFALLEYVANGHNDIIMMFFVVLAIWMAMRNRHALALFFILLSVMVKYSSLPLVPLFIFYALLQLWRKEKRNRHIQMYVLQSIIALALVVIGLIVPFWRGPHTLSTTLLVANIPLYSFYTFLNDFGGFTNDKIHTISLYIAGGCYVCAMALTAFGSKRGFIMGCFITMFAILAFAASYVQAWYLIWPCMIALLLPFTEMYLVAALISYTAAMTELVHPYMMSWGAAEKQNIAIFNIISSMTYLILFGPPVLLLIGYYINKSTTKITSWFHIDWRQPEQDNEQQRREIEAYDSEIG